MEALSTELAPSRSRTASRTIDVVLLGISLGSMAGTLLLTIFRLGDPWSKYGVLLAAMAPFGTPAALGTLLISLPLSVRRGRARLVGRSCATLAALLLITHLWWLAPLYVGSRPQAEGSQRLVVLTQNFEQGDPAQLERLVRTERVDVLVICDAGVVQTRAAIALADRAGLRHRVDEGGSLVFSRYPVTAVARISAGGSSRVVRVHGTPLGDITVYALHPTPPYEASKWAADYERINTYLADHPSDRTIIAGDLNATLDNAGLRRIVARGYQDALTQARAGWHPTWPSDSSRRIAGVSIPPVLSLDHVLTSTDLVVTKVVTVPLPTADHAGVLATVGRRLLAND